MSKSLATLRAGDYAGGPCAGGRVRVGGAGDDERAGTAVPVVRVGWPDEFIEHGKVEALREKYGLTAEAALEKARPYLAGMESGRLAGVR